MRRVLLLTAGLVLGYISLSGCHWSSHHDSDGGKQVHVRAPFTHVDVDKDHDDD